jgi:hypothetical protein
MPAAEARQSSNVRVAAGVWRALGGARGAGSGQTVLDELDRAGQGCQARRRGRGDRYAVRRHGERWWGVSNMFRDGHATVTFV